MAEFQEVMRQAKRMCEASGDTCLSCPVDGGDTCVFMKSPWSLTKEKIAETEKIVINWAEKHPEPRYPTWAEAWRQLFPGADLIPCPRKHFWFDCACIGEDSCQMCVNRQMYPFVAEKLGVKPIGGASDEKA